MVFFMPKTKPIIEGDNIRFKSEADEVLTKKEFIQLYLNQKNEYFSLDKQLSKLREQLNDIEEIEETDELKKFIEMLKQAKKIENKDMIVEQIQKIESRLNTVKAILNDFKETYDKIKDEGTDSNTD